jgi:hypothetical protein
MQKFVNNRAKCRWSECYISIVSLARDRATNLTKRYAETCNVALPISAIAIPTRYINTYASECDRSWGKLRSVGAIALARPPAEGCLKGCRAIAPKGQRVRLCEAVAAEGEKASRREAIADNSSYKNKRKKSTSACR